MSVSSVRVHPDTYLDSLLLMSATVRMEDVEGVEWAAAVMASSEALKELAGAGFNGHQLDGLGANDLVLAVRGRDDDAVEAGLLAGVEAAFSERQEKSPAAAAPPRSIAAAVRANPEADVAIVSVPGQYAALEAHHALTAGLHVLLFSDGVPLAEEVELKQRAATLGLLVMGPGAGTAVIGGTGLGFANVLQAGRDSDSSSERGVGVVAAAGTGAQEVSALLDRWGVGVTQVIGVGGRDLSEQVGGSMARLAVRTLDADPKTDAVLLVSKPPAADAAAAVLSECRSTPAVAVFLGIDSLDVPARVTLAPTLEQGAGLAAELVGASCPRLSAGLRDRVAAVIDRVDPSRTTVRGLFSGGTLCYEAQLILEGLLGPVHSNEPLRAEHGLPAPEGAHVLLDLGAEEYTRGVPHPMIDPSTRLKLLGELSDDPSVAVVLLDVVLGLGAHDDPARELAPLCQELMSGDGPQVVAYVLGTEGDPQVHSRQRTILEDAGCIVPETNARAAHVAAALARRQPELAETGL